MAVMIPRSAPFTLLLLLAFWFANPTRGVSQEANNSLLYSFQAVQFSKPEISYDPITLVLPGVAHAGGFSSYLENPAAAALFDESFGSFGLAFRNTSERSHFLGNSMDMDGRQLGLSNLGFVYKFPTVRGSLVMGMGYSQNAFVNRALSIQGRNTGSSMTDFFKIPGSLYENIAYETYAIDYADEEMTWFDSVFRIGFPPGNFPGIRQEAEVLESGYGGEFSGFVATELVKNLMAGVSLGIHSGRFVFDRTFLEIDEFNDYDGDFIVTDEGNTDIDKILLDDRLQSDFISLSVRLGAIYRVGNRVQVGASWTLPGKISIDEEFDARIASTFDNAVVFEDEVFTDFSWSVNRPGRIHLGAALLDLSGVTLSLSAEHVNYSKTRLDFDSDMFEEQRNENRYLSEVYRPVWNFRGGVAWDLTDYFTIRGGYGFQPSRFRHLDLDLHHFSGGVGFSLGQRAFFDLGVQYARFEETSVLYEYEDHLFQLQNQLVDRETGRFQVLGTLRLLLY